MHMIRREDTENTTASHLTLLQNCCSSVSGAGFGNNVMQATELWKVWTERIYIKSVWNMGESIPVLRKRERSSEFDTHEDF